MVKELSIKDQDLNRFITDEKGKVHAYLRKYYSISDDVFDDIFQESSMALLLNIQDGKLSNLTNVVLGGCMYCRYGGCKGCRC